MGRLCMESLFENATEFNQDLSLWDVHQVTNMYKMFSNARAFDQDLSPWEVSNVLNMRDMFDGAENLYQSFCTHAWAEAASRSSLLKCRAEAASMPIQLVHSVHLFTAGGRFFSNGS